MHVVRAANAQSHDRILQCRQQSSSTPARCLLFDFAARRVAVRSRTKTADACGILARGDVLLV